MMINILLSWKFIVLSYVDFIRRIKLWMRVRSFRAMCIFSWNLNALNKMRLCENEYKNVKMSWPILSDHWLVYRFISQARDFEAMANELKGNCVLMCRLNPSNFNISGVIFIRHRRWWSILRHVHVVSALAVILCQHNDVSFLSCDEMILFYKTTFDRMRSQSQILKLSNYFCLPTVTVST